MYGARRLVPFPGKPKGAKRGARLVLLRGGNPNISMNLVALGAHLKGSKESGFPPLECAGWRPRLVGFGRVGPGQVPVLEL